MQQYILDIIACVISPLTSLIAIIVTIKNSNKNQERINKIQNENFKISLEEQQRLFESNKKFEDFRNASSIMPYFKLSDDIKIECRNIMDSKILDFKMKLSNIGNGTAINVNLLIKEENNNIVVYETKYADINLVYSYNNFMFDNIVRCNESTEFGICCDYHNYSTRVFIKVKFEDMMRRRYDQEFSFYYEYDNYENKAFRVESCTPSQIR